MVHLQPFRYNSLLSTVLTGRQLAELMDLSQDRDAWKQLVVEGVDLQPPD